MSIMLNISDIYSRLTNSYQRTAKLKKLYDTSEFQSLGREIGMGSPLSFG